MEILELELVIDRYINKLINDKMSNHTIMSYRKTLKDMYDCFKNNDVNVSDLKKEVLGYVDALGSQYKASTINSKRSAIRSFISFLFEREYIDEDFSGKINNLKLNKVSHEILEPQEITKLLNYLAEDIKGATGYSIYFKVRNLTLIMFMLYTGTRRSEVVGVRFDDIDFINNEVKVLGKGNKERIIPLKSELKECLYNFRDTIEKLDKAGFNVKSQYLFRSERINQRTKQKDSPMVPRNVLKLVKQLCSEAGIEKNITAHTLRHVFASYLIYNNVNIRSLSDLLGHSVTSTTLNVYAHIINSEMNKKEMDKLEY